MTPQPLSTPESTPAAATPDEGRAAPLPQSADPKWDNKAPVDRFTLLVKLLSSSRYLFLIAVASTYIATLVLLMRGAWETTVMVGYALGISSSSAHGSVHAQALKIVDTFLVATVLYVLATGFYQIFVQSHLPLPSWMRISGPGAMEGQLIGVIVTVMAVTALVRLTEWDGASTSILPYGIATAALITSISLFGWVHHVMRQHPDEE